MSRAEIKDLDITRDGEQSFLTLDCGGFEIGPIAISDKVLRKMEFLASVEQQDKAMKKEEGPMNPHVEHFKKQLGMKTEEGGKDEQEKEEKMSKHTCPECQGEMVVSRTVSDGNGCITREPEECSWCEATGILDDEKMQAWVEADQGETIMREERGH